jgi:hypothetical protein
MTAEEISAYKVDKSTWKRGPWDSEPDRVDFHHAGLPCLLLRHPNYGSWCGYVAVPKGHPAYGKDPLADDFDIDESGLNYGAPCGGQICHVPQPGEPDDVWWLGMDFAHSFDKSPGSDARLRACGPEGAALVDSKGARGIFREVYRNLKYVRRVIEQLAEELAAMK